MIPDDVAGLGRLDDRAAVLAGALCQDLVALDHRQRLRQEPFARVDTKTDPDVVVVGSRVRVAVLILALDPVLAAVVGDTKQVVGHLRPPARTQRAQPLSRLDAPDSIDRSRCRLLRAFAQAGIEWAPSPASIGGAVIINASQLVITNALRSGSLFH
jgi:hypothetical protein